MGHRERMQPAKSEIRASFSRAASSYEEHAVIQKRVLEVLEGPLSALSDSKGAIRRILEIGTGTGLLTRRLSSLLSPEHIFCLDLSPDMLMEARRRLLGTFGDSAPGQIHYISADGEALPFPDRASFDLIVSASTFQWFSDLPMAIGQMVGLLLPGGRLIALFFSRGTLKELEEAMNEGLGRNEGHRLLTSTFWSAKELRKGIEDMAMARGDIALIGLQEFTFTRRYAGLAELLRAFKQTGTAPSAKRPATGHRPLIRTPGMLKRVEEAYMERFGSIRATYHVLLLDMVRKE